MEAAHTNTPILSSVQPCSVLWEERNSCFAGCASKSRAAEVTNRCAMNARVTPMGRVN